MDERVENVWQTDEKKGRYTKYINWGVRKHYEGIEVIKGSFQDSFLCSNSEWRLKAKCGLQQHENTY